MADWIPTPSRLKCTIRSIFGNVNGAQRTQENVFPQSPMVPQVTSTTQCLARDTQEVQDTQISPMISKPSGGVMSGRRRKLALVIGIGDYAGDLKLKNPANDAQEVSLLLKRIGFITDGPKLNLTYTEMKVACTKFECTIQKGDMVLFYFAGHGVQWEDQNYLVPKDTVNINNKNLNEHAIKAQRILDDLSAKNPYITIFLLDCCRTYHLRNDGLYADQRALNTSASTGLKEMNKAGSLIAFACAPGAVSDDGLNERNGLFTKHLLQHMGTPNVDVVNILRIVTKGVKKDSHEKQNPYLNISLTDNNIYLYEKTLDLPSLKSGIKFGGSGGHNFDDSSTRGFTHTHYLRGMITGCTMELSEWCQFLYSSPDNPENILETELQGTRPSNDVIERFCLAENERINKIQVVVDNEILYVDNIRKSVPLIRGIRFFTTYGRVSQSIDHLTGDLYTEQFDEYTVGYVTGRSGLYVDQLEFHWYHNVMHS